MPKASPAVRLARFNELKAQAAEQLGLDAGHEKVAHLASLRMHHEMLCEKQVYGELVDADDLLRTIEAIDKMKPPASRSLEVRFVKPEDNPPSADTPDANERTSDALNENGGPSPLDHAATVARLEEMKAQAELENREAIKARNDMTSMLADPQHAKDRWRGMVIDPSRQRGNPFSARNDPSPYPRYIYASGHESNRASPLQDFDRMPPGNSTHRRDC
jgi:hypothetical protein